MIRIQNFINNEFVDSQTSKTLEVFDPARGSVYATQPSSDAVDVVFAIQAAKKAFEKWSKLSAQKKSDWLMKIADGIEARFDEFAEAESRDVGKPLWLAKEVDIPRAIENFRFFATRILHGEERFMDMNGKALNYVIRKPVGVCALISPWNLPLYLLTWKIAPCLASGNTAVCKPSEVTPMTAYLLAQVFRDIGLPPGVCNIIFGNGSEAGAPLVSHPSVPLISFTGGTATGEAISKLAAPQFKKLSLELGGKNSLIVLKDADLKKLMPLAVRSAFLNSGQICLCNERVFVHESIYDKFVEEFVAEAKKLKIGNPNDPEIFMGPVVSKEHHQKILDSIEEAQKEKGELVFGGKAIQIEGEFKDGYFIEPAVITDLSDCAELQQKEVFGPFTSIRPFKYNHEAVKWANTTPYGLSAAVFGQDISKASKVAAQLDVGTVWINTWLKRDLRVPFGGMKASGMGREGGKDSFNFFTEAQTICVQL